MHNITSHLFHLQEMIRNLEIQKIIKCIFFMFCRRTYRGMKFFFPIEIHSVGVKSNSKSSAIFFINSQAMFSRAIF